MLWLKGCPRCQGDLFEEPAIGLHTAASRFFSCLQCGHVLTDEEEAALAASRRGRQRPPGARIRVA